MTTPHEVLADQSNVVLAEALGHLDIEMKRIEAAMKAIKAEFGTRGVEKIEAPHFTITKSESVRWTIDGKGLKEEFGEAWVTAHSKVSDTITSWRITVNKAAL